MLKKMFKRLNMDLYQWTLKHIYSVKEYLMIFLFPIIVYGTYIYLSNMNYDLSICILMICYILVTLVIYVFTVVYIIALISNNNITLIIYSLLVIVFMIVYGHLLMEYKKSNILIIMASMISAYNCYCKFYISKYDFNKNYYKNNGKDFKMSVLKYEAAIRDSNYYFVSLITCSLLIGNIFRNVLRFSDDLKANLWLLSSTLLAIILNRVIPKLHLFFCIKSIKNNKIH